MAPQQSTVKVTSLIYPQWNFVPELSCTNFSRKPSMLTPQGRRSPTPSDHLRAVIFYVDRLDEQRHPDLAHKQKLAEENPCMCAEPISLFHMQILQKALIDRRTRDHENRIGLSQAIQLVIFHSKQLG